MKHLLILVLLLISSVLHAQQDAVPSGGDAYGNGGSANYTVGQVVYLTATSSTIVATQGVQQPYEASSNGIGVIGGTRSAFFIYPNPCTTFFTLEINGFLNEQTEISITDINGKEVLSQSIYSDQSKIDLQGLSASVYTLAIRSGGVIHYFKIVKSN